MVTRPFARQGAALSPSSLVNPLLTAPSGPSQQTISQIPRFSNNPPLNYTTLNPKWQLLLDAGADVDGGRAPNMPTPLGVARQFHHIALADLLTSRGATVQGPTRGRQVIHRK